MRQRKARAELPDQAGGWPVLEDSSVVATLLVGEGGEVLAANGKMRELLHAPSARAITAMNLRDFLVDPADWRAWEAVLATGTARSTTLRLRKPRGAEIVLRGDLRAAEGARAALGIFLDATREHQLARAVQQSARMEALGSLTAGIAHDFNNLLTILVGNLSLVAEDVRADERLFGKVKPARDAAKRGAELIRQLLAFARREDADVGVVDAGRVAADLEPLLGRALGNRISLETRIAPGQWPVRASAAQLESVIVNLAVNSRDSIAGKGKVVVSVGERTVAAAGRAGAREVAISVADDGCGIPPELRERVFEPFFSTKVERGGTGLGLSMVRWFAESANGSVRLESTPERGTTVTLLLPRAAEAQTDATAGTTPLSTLPAGRERVLVLAPEEGLRSTIRQILEVLGYEVRTAADTGSLHGVLRDHRPELLIVDGQLCGRGRAEWLERALADQGRVGLIFASDAPLPEFAVALGAVPLSKPFSLAELAKTVRRTLDAVAARPSEGTATG